MKGKLSIQLGIEAVRNLIKGFLRHLISDQSSKHILQLYLIGKKVLNSTIYFILESRFLVSFGLIFLTVLQAELFSTVWSYDCTADKEIEVLCFSACTVMHPKTVGWP